MRHTSDRIFISPEERRRRVFSLSLLIMFGSIPVFSLKDEDLPGEERRWNSEKPSVGSVSC